MKINEVHNFYLDDADSELQDKEIIIDGNLIRTTQNGVEVEYNDANETDSPFYGSEKISTTYITNFGNIQHNHVDGSFYFLRHDGTFATYVDGNLGIDDPNGEYSAFIAFANGILP